jgi:hypothetical protein
LASFGLVTGPAGAERAQKGNLIVSLNGGVTPRKLPRGHTAPVGVRLEGGIETADEGPLPRVQKVKLALAFRGLVNTRGLPVCKRSQLRIADSTQAMRACGPALIGRGKLYARVFVPHQEPFGLHSDLLAFNGRTKRGGPAVWVHAYSTDPPVSFILPFRVRRQPGQFRTVLETVVPRSVGPWPRFARFGILVGREFSYEGNHRSYLNASCPLPSEWTAGFLSFARATFSFAEAPDLTTESVRSCRAR